MQPRSYQNKPPAMLPRKNPLTQPLILYLIRRVSKISGVRIRISVVRGFNQVASFCLDSKVNPVAICTLFRERGCWYNWFEPTPPTPSFSDSPPRLHCKPWNGQLIISRHKQSCWHHSHTNKSGQLITSFDLMNYYRRSIVTLRLFIPDLLDLKSRTRLGVDKVKPKGWIGIGTGLDWVGIGD